MHWLHFQIPAGDAFDAFGHSADDAWAALFRGWSKYCAEYDVDPCYILRNKGDVRHVVVGVGCWRDGENLVGPYGWAPMQESVAAVRC